MKKITFHAFSLQQACLFSTFPPASGVLQCTPTEPGGRGGKMMWDGCPKYSEQLAVDSEQYAADRVFLMMASALHKRHFP